MGILDVPYCPNPDCSRERLKKGEKCPLCGSLAQEFGVNAAGNLMIEKKRRQKMKAKNIEETISAEETKTTVHRDMQEKERKENLISDEMTDEEIKVRIYEDMTNLKRHEAGTGIDGFLTALSGTAMERISASLLKAIVDQNKIMIRQNELILRNLRKLTNTA